MKDREVGANRAVWVPDVLFVDIDVCHGCGCVPIIEGLVSFVVM